MGNKKEMKRRRKSGPLKPFKRRQTINNYDVLREQQATVREEGEDVVQKKLEILSQKKMEMLSQKHCQPRHENLTWNLMLIMKRMKYNNLNI